MWILRKSGVPIFRALWRQIGHARQGCRCYNQSWTSVFKAWSTISQMGCRTAGVSVSQSKRRYRIQNQPLFEGQHAFQAISRVGMHCCVVQTLLVGSGQSRSDMDMSMSAKAVDLSVAVEIFLRNSNCCQTNYLVPTSIAKSF